MKKQILGLYLIGCFILMCSEPTFGTSFGHWAMYEIFIILNLANAVRLINNYYRTAK